MNLSNSHIQNRFGHLIAVEGCIGVGKTTWAKALTKTRLSQLVLENFTANPFLQSFYENPHGNALETELHFLLIHYHQLKKIQKENATETITDFAFFKDNIFAELNISKPEEIKVFTHLYNYLSEQLRPVDLVIYIRGGDETILNRIENRKRAGEMKINEDYFIKLSRAYEGFFARYPGHVYTVQADQVDCIKYPEVVLDVSSDIDKILRISKPTGFSGNETAR